jgi:DNA polymerase-1
MLLLVDGTNIVMRYASAMAGDLDAPTAEDIEKVCNAVTRAILACCTDAGATHVIVALDSGVGSWRRALYPEYKAHRTTKTLEWTNRLNITLTFSGIMCVRVPEFEADDIIATLAARAQKNGKEVAVLSGDSDLLQLASLACSVIQFGKHPEAKFVARSMQWIKEKYGLAHAGHLALYKALVGEPGDGIPGVPGIGPVKARKILSLNTHPSEIALLLKGEVEVEAFKLALQLVTLRDDVPIEPIPGSECRVRTARAIA